MIQIEAIYFPGYGTKTPNLKTQITNNIKITNSNDQNSKFKTGAIAVEHPLSDRNVSVIGISDLDIIWDLEFES